VLQCYFLGVVLIVAYAIASFNMISVIDRLKRAKGQAGDTFSHRERPAHSSLLKEYQLAMRIQINGRSSISLCALWLPYD